MAIPALAELKKLACKNTADLLEMLKGGVDPDPEIAGAALCLGLFRDGQQVGRAETYHPKRLPMVRERAKIRIEQGYDVRIWYSLSFHTFDSRQ